VVITKRERERSAWERDRSKNPSELDIERNQQKQEKQNKSLGSYGNAWLL
jgi:hypothetical protein